jgi:hypothetical protein
MDHPVKPGDDGEGMGRRAHDRATLVMAGLDPAIHAVAIELGSLVSDTAQSRRGSPGQAG